MPIEDSKRESLKSKQVEIQISAPESRSEKDKFVSTVAPTSVYNNNTSNTVSQVKNADITAEEYVKEYIKSDFGATEKAESLKEQDTSCVIAEEKKIYKQEEKETPKAVEKTADYIPQNREIPYYRIIGEAFNSYVIVEKNDTVLLIDKHAAHERIIFEKLREGLKYRGVTSQMLMLPIEIMMTSDEIQILGSYREEIEAIGFEFTLGRYTVKVTAIPEGISTDAVSDMLVVMAERIKNGTGSANLTKDIVFEKALYQASCKAAIKAGREYTQEHIKWIVEKLMAIPDITVCPHGRPVAMELSKKSLDRQFERT